MTRDARPPTLSADASGAPAAVAHPPGGAGHHGPGGRLPHAGLLIVAGQVLLMVLAPALDDGGNRVPPTVFAAAMAVSVLTVRALGHRRLALTLAAVCGLALAWIVASHHALLAARLPGTLTLIAAYSVAAVLCVRTAFAGGLSTAQRILCGAACYLMVGVVFAIVHALVGIADDSAYAFADTAGVARARRWIDSFWMSFSLLTTAGFSELEPAGKWGYLVAMLESVCGVLFPATLIARIASLPTPPPGPGGHRTT